MNDVTQMVAEYGPEGNVESGASCSVYYVDGDFYKLNGEIDVETVDSYFTILEELEIPYPETEVWEENIPVYGMGETTVVKQAEVETALEEILDEPEAYVDNIRELGLKAASSNVKLDLGLQNLAFIDGDLGTLDINDQEAIWVDEDLALHLMGSYLLNSTRKLEDSEGLYAPDLKNLAEKWKGAV